MQDYLSNIRKNAHNSNKFNILNYILILYMTFVITNTYYTQHVNLFSFNTLRYAIFLFLQLLDFYGDL